MALLNSQDIEQINRRGIDPGEIERQVACFRNGFPPLEIVAPATVGQGIVRLDEEQVRHYCARYAEQAPGLNIVKFVPASGAATRMFKDLFVFMDEYPDSGLSFEQFVRERKLESVAAFFANIRRFAFFDELAAVYSAQGDDIERRLAEGDYADIVRKVLTDQGLGYGQLPKGLVTFHRYPEKPRKAAGEHLSEGVQYAVGAGRKVRLHFTVSPEHQPMFEALLRSLAPDAEREAHVRVEADFSVQSPSTDTIAVDADNVPVRDAQGRLVFRPGGHGALIKNLGEVDADIVFIKNIDNVAPDRLKAPTVRYKQALAGYLLELQAGVRRYLDVLEGEGFGDHLASMEDFVQQTLCYKLPERYFALDTAAKKEYLRAVFERPIRVCGMVVNEGEPGGGPFWVRGADGETSLQVVESAQIDLSDAQKRRIFEASTHFNPVDLVCALKDRRGRPYDLSLFVDPQAGFISRKSLEGREIKALERPGLWNGAMSRWTTVFVEVPAETFSPVKTVNDLLRAAHQGEEA